MIALGLVFFVKNLTQLRKNAGFNPCKLLLTTLFKIFLTVLHDLFSKRNTVPISILNVWFSFLINDQIFLILFILC